jgi:hypothetical protein
MYISSLRTIRIVQVNLRPRFLNTNTTTGFFTPSTSHGTPTSGLFQRTGQSMVEKQPPELEEPWQRKLRFWSVISAIGITYTLMVFGNYGEHEHIFSEVGRVLDRG